MRRLIHIGLLIAAILHIGAGSASAQSSADRDKMRMAQAYERSGDLRSAARIYQELYAADGRNEGYFQGVVRTLMALQQYSSLLPLVETRIKETPRLETLVLAGALHAKLGATDKAMQFWNSAVKLADEKESAYVLIAQEQGQISLNALALDSYRSARKQNGSPTAYAEEIGRLAAITGDVETAAKEALSFYSVDGDLVRVQRQISLLLALEGGAAAVGTELDRLPDSYTDVLRLKQWFYRQTMDWDKALRVTERLDAQSRQRGQEMLLFADGARMDGQYDVAIAGYGKVMSGSVEERVRMSAAYGSARALEQKLRACRVLTRDEAQQLIARYDEIISRYGQHPIAADALLASASLQDDVLGKTADAQDRLLRLMNQWKGTTVWPLAGLRLADIYLATNLDAQAVEVLRSVASGPVVVVGEKRDLALLRLADLYLWSGKLDSARTLYSALTDSPNSPAANDAIDRLLLIDLAQDDSAAVLAIARALGLQGRRKFIDAGNDFSAVASTTKDTDLQDRALMLAAQCYVDGNASSKAEEMLVQIINRVPETIYGDRALFLAADVLIKRNDSKGAAAMLEAILTQYPRSILIPTARDRIRSLRGDS